jgi:hypothetical protein
VLELLFPVVFSCLPACVHLESVSFGLQPNNVPILLLLNTMIRSARIREKKRLKDMAEIQVRMRCIGNQRRRRGFKILSGQCNVRLPWEVLCYVLRACFISELV